MVKINSEELKASPNWHKPWTPEEEVRFKGVLQRSGDRVLSRQRTEHREPDGRMPEARAREFFGKHYENVMAESNFRRDLMATARAMDEGRIPYTREAAQELLDRHRCFMDAPSHLIPPEDLNVKAL